MWSNVRLGGKKLSFPSLQLQKGFLKWGLAGWFLQWKILAINWWSSSTLYIYIYIYNYIWSSSKLSYSTYIYRYMPIHTYIIYYLIDWGHPIFRRTHFRHGLWIRWMNIHLDLLIVGFLVIFTYLRMPQRLWAKAMSGMFCWVYWFLPGYLEGWGLLIVPGAQIWPLFLVMTIFS